MTKEDILKNILIHEKELYRLKSQLKENQPLIDNEEDYIMTMLKSNKMDEGNYYKIVLDGYFKEISIGELKKYVSENFLNHIVVDINFDATKEYLKVHGGLEDELIKFTLENLKLKQFSVKEVLKLKNEE